MDLEYKCNKCNKTSSWHISSENISNFVCKNCGEFIGSSNGKVVRFVHPPTNDSDFRFTEHVDTIVHEMQRREEIERQHLIDNIMRQMHSRR